MSHDGFRLEPVLKLRQNDRDERCRALAEVRHERDELQKRLDELNERIEQNRAAWRAAQRLSPPVFDQIQNFGVYHDRLTAARQKIETAAAALDLEISACTERLTDSHREVRVLENLKERRDEERLLQNRKNEK